MNKQEIIERFFAKGKLLTPSALQKIVEFGIEPIKTDKILIDEKDVPSQDENQAKVIKNLSYKPKEASTEDFIKFYTSKYEKMKAILTSRLQKNFISLNKVPSFRKEIHLIGIVKDIKKGDKILIELEDTTGSISVVFKKDMESSLEPIELDDAVAVKGISAGKIIYGRQVFLPDIPLRQPVKGKVSIGLLSNLCLDEAASKDVEKIFNWVNSGKFKHVFIAGKIGDNEKFEYYVENYCKNKKIFVIEEKEDYPSTASTFKNTNIIPLSNPSMVEISNVKILNISKFDISMLKKRYLGKTKTILPEDYLVLDVVPDIVNFASTDHSITNYKSVTAVSAGSVMGNFRPVTIDLSTREVYTESIM
jgi:DNA polymerase II small subunit/DNA polymerase delta subunit B